MNNDPEPCLTEESRLTGSISFNNYWKYLHAGASHFSLVAFIIIFLMGQVIYMAIDYWLTFWTQAEELRYLRSERFTTSDESTETSMIESSLPDFNPTESNLTDFNITDGSTTILDWIKDVDTTTGVYVYSILIGGLFFVVLIRTAYFYIICMSASVKLHNKMFKSIIRAQPSFFDQNPVGKKPLYYYNLT